MKFRIAAVIAVAASIASADTLTLRDGRTIEGSYLGGTARQIRFAVGDAIQIFNVSDVQSIRFETEAAPAAAPAPAPAPAAETRILNLPATTPVRTTPVSGIEIPVGTNITIRMIDDVDSNVATVGQTFRASIDEPVIVDGREVVPRGADVTTKLVELKDPNKITGGGQLTLDIASITVNGKEFEVDTAAITTAGESRTGQSAKVIGGTAALGAIIGAIAGGGKGAAIGAVAGGGAGTAIQVLTQGPRVRIPSETRLTFALQAPVRIQ
ncbi:MAG TPA: hypothetical protein PLA43_09060 [Bryobacteraceae bacterium]|nr:hypothetical protein [Bryobacteraceae bacterium]HOL70297.1 hypothetical protein [Bryobacteraceae bacterium]HOQ44896.1 hypothetical protein [Bryobacteraceae bacterium]HPQ16424.1 hypothetical protein [Bryobacteraceae bacterium]HPU72094.1 hypothetical protein [Bryobacteraceae bacterium]